MVNISWFERLIPTQWRDPLADSVSPSAITVDKVTGQRNQLDLEPAEAAAYEKAAMLASDV